MSKENIVIVGGGFGGVKAALELAKNEQANVALLSDRTDFQYNPALYHTATGGLREQVSLSLGEILPAGKVAISQGSAKKLDRKRKKIITEEGHIIPYDTLVLALGSVTNYFGIKGLKEYSYGVKSTKDVEQFKAHLHKQLTDEKQPDLNYLIVGGGPTGIELAGALPDYLRKLMKNHGIKKRKINISLIEASPRLLPRSPKAVSRAVRRQLKRLGVKLYLAQAVQGETADSLMVNGHPIKSHTVVWTAGMANNPFFTANGFIENARHKVVVDSHLQAEDNIYVIGDNAATAFSGMAQTALNDAKFVAGDITRRQAGQPRPAYEAKKPISIIPAGPYWASVEWGKYHFSGKKGWLLREAADWIGFHDLEPWWKATEQWSSEFAGEEDCPVCAVV